MGLLDVLGPAGANAVDGVVAGVPISSITSTLAAVFQPALTLADQSQPTLDSGSTAWMLMSSAMVLLMVPGLALFYGGMVRRKNVLNTMMYAFVAMAVVGVQWVAFGYALAFGTSIGGVIGWDTKYLFLHGIDITAQYGDKQVPELVFIMFQGKFAIITPALIAGAVAERMRMSTFVWFILLWTTLVYCPLAHWVWATGGWLFEKGVLDFAGGTVVHISSGISALVLAKLVGPRQDFGKPTWAISPYNLALTLTGAGLLWFGWFGFNGGSAVALEKPVAGSTAVLAFTTTQVAAAAAALAWMLIEWRHHGKPTSLGVASGIVAGLVCVTPAAGHVMPLYAIIMGALASVVCYTAVQLKGRFGYDDTLDAFGVHGVGGILGALLTGVFCFMPAKGLIFGETKQVGLQALGAGAGIALSLVGTLVIGLVLKATIGLRVSAQQESDGLDIAVHGERVGHA